MVLPRAESKLRELPALCSFPSQGRETTVTLLFWSLTLP